MTDGCAILDVGAHDRKLGMQLATLRPAIHYQSMDVDPAGEHDFRSMSEIGDEQFDLVNCSEVIEHIPFEDGVALLKEILRVLKPGGRVVVSTPNLKHPHRYWTSPDHITPYNYDALAGILLGVGYEMEVMYRVHNQPFFQFYFRRLIGVWLHWYLDIDFALSVIAVARRPNDS